MTLPFELVRRGPGIWRGRWADEQLGIELAGTEQAPDPALLAALDDVIARWPEVRAIITAHCRALAADDHVPLDRGNGGFAARTCGFDSDLYFQSITLPDPDAPGRVAVTFYTGLPDGHATYEIVLDGGVPTALGAFAS